MKFNPLVVPMELFDGFYSILRRCFSQVLSVGPMPHHIAFIMDGNRRYGRKHSLKEGEAYHIAFINLMSILKYCYEMGIDYISVYAFSIDNFKRKSVEVQFLMNLLKEKLKALMEDISTVNRLGIKVVFLGNLELFDKAIEEEMKRAMMATAKNTRLVLFVFVAYTSTNEIVHGVQGSCKEKCIRFCEGKNRKQQEDNTIADSSISSADLERHMFFSRYPDILIRTSGETRLSNFMLWQTTFCPLCAPKCLWPELSFRHLVWAILQYQRKYLYLEKIKKQMQLSPCLS